MKNGFNIPVVNFSSQYLNLPRIIWLNRDGNKRSRWDNRGNSFFIQFGIELKKIKNESKEI